MLKAIHDLYARDKTFLDYLAHDLDDDAVWFNNSEFARYHDVNGKKILSIFTTDTKNKKLDITIDGHTPEGISKGSGVLFVRAKDFKGDVKLGKIKIDGKSYVVAEAHLIQDQVWRITLEANN